MNEPFLLVEVGDIDVAERYPGLPSWVPNWPRPLVTELSSEKINELPEIRGRMNATSGGAPTLWRPLPGIIAITAAYVGTVHTVLSSSGKSEYLGSDSIETVHPLDCLSHKTKEEPTSNSPRNRDVVTTMLNLHAEMMKVLGADQGDWKYKAKRAVTNGLNKFPR